MEDAVGSPDDVKLDLPVSQPKNVVFGISCKRDVTLINLLSIPLLAFVEMASSAFLCA